MKRSREPEEGPPDAAVAATVRSSAIEPGADHGGLKDPGAAEDDSETAPPAAKITNLDLSDSDSGVKMHCSLPPHKEPLVFSSYAEYETHYRSQHTNRCAQCRKNFPSAHLLGLHIEETHDSFVMVRRERGERTYSCFVEGCERKCSTPQKRRMHLIDKHMYPKNFFFAVTRDGIDGRRSLLVEGGGGRRRKSSTTAAAPRPTRAAQRQGREPTSPEAKPAASTDDQSTAEHGEKSAVQQPDREMEDLSNAMSALQFVPMSVRFGRGRKAGFAKR